MMASIRLASTVQMNITWGFTCFNTIICATLRVEGCFNFRPVTVVLIFPKRGEKTLVPNKSD